MDPIHDDLTGCILIGGMATVIFAFMVGLVIAPTMPADRMGDARATIAAATAAVASRTAESELAALERAASVAATAAPSEGVGR